MRDKTFRPAPFFPRAAAYLLDRLILAAVLFIPRLIAAVRAFSGQVSGAVLFRFTWADILFWALGAVYFILFTVLTGSTLGKKAMGLTVVAADGSRPGALTVICRETFGRYLSSLLCIGYLLCLADPDRGALHDRICDTAVVYAPPREEKRAAPTARRAAAAAPALPSGIPGDDWYAPNR